MIQVKIKLQEGAILPKRVNEYASGYDCYVCLDEYMASLGHQSISPGENRLIPLGFSMEIPEGYEARIRSRSGLAKSGIVTVHGTIDCDYRGIVMANVFNHSYTYFKFRNGDRICQMVIQKVEPVELVLATELSETERGSKGHGSSGV